MRGFGGINTFLVGDFYQLPPVGGTPLMSNPRSQTVLENARVANMMSRVWSCADDDLPGSLQRWSETYCATGCKVMDLEVNHRSGGDRWFSDCLKSCREGNLDDDDWRFFHGLPTVAAATSEAGAAIVTAIVSMIQS